MFFDKEILNRISQNLNLDQFVSHFYLFIYFIIYDCLGSKITY